MGTALLAAAKNVFTENTFFTPGLPRRRGGLVRLALLMKRAYRIGALATLLATVACGGPKSGTVVGNGAQVQVNLSSYDERVTTKSLDLEDGGTIDELLVAVRRIRFTPGTSCEDVEDEADDIAGPIVADLVNPGAVSGGTTGEIVAGPFCRLRIEFHVAGDGEVPPDLAGASILVRGRRADGASYTVRSRLGDRFELDAEDEPFQVPEGPSSLHLAFAIGASMNALDLDTLGPAPITIDDDENSDRLAAFEDAMKDAARLFRDDDGDGLLSPDEHAPGSELAE